MEAAILEDLANQTGRNFGRADLDFARKMAKRLRRKFSLTIAAETLLEQATVYQTLYQFASSILAGCLQPSPDDYAHPENVEMEKLLAQLHEQFPAEPETILKTIGGWVVYYEYLR